MKTFTSKPASRHFVEALENVMSDETITPHQKDPLGIVQAWKKYDEIRPLIFTKKIHHVYAGAALHTCGEYSSQMFCWLVCKNGCPAGFKDYNKSTFHTPTWI